MDNVRKKHTERQNDANLPEKKSTKAKKRRLKKIRSYIMRTFLCLFTAIGLILIGVLGALYVIFKGPSVTACDLLTNTLLETSALKFVPRIYFSQSEVDQIVARNAVIEPEVTPDTSLVVIPETVDKDAEQEEDIEIVHIQGATYQGVLMIVKDPSRVSVAVSRPEGFREDKRGKRLHELVEDYNAIGGINGGAFSDSGGTGNGGNPLGLVISDGKLYKRANSGDYQTVIGFNAENKLLVGKFTTDEATEMGIRDAVAFGPALVINGEPASISGESSGLNPRTAIGQRADGAVLMLVIDGRQVNSLGASMSDVIEIMLRYGAVNAANLDGGSSSNLYYKGEYLNSGVALTGSRDLPTAFIVR